MAGYTMQSKRIKENRKYLEFIPNRKRVWGILGLSQRPLGSSAKTEFYFSCKTINVPENSINVWKNKSKRFKKAVPKNQI